GARQARDNHLAPHGRGLAAQERPGLQAARRAKDVDYASPSCEGRESRSRCITATARCRAHVGAGGAGTGLLDRGHTHSAMHQVGVDGAIAVSPFSMYRYDASYAVEVQQAHPDRFALVKPVDPDDPAVAEVIADWKQTPGTVGIRIILTQEANRTPDDPGLDRICRAAAGQDFPVNLLCSGNLD